MTFWGLVQTLVDLVLLSGVIAAWVRLTRPPKDDPRLSKGLQLLQSKISVLEDLSDRTENQVSQLTTLLEHKCKELQVKIAESERQITRIESSAKKSLEVANIFQDRIPHEEIIERQNTVKYVTAARMAHRGATLEEIMEKVDLSQAELEFIARVNRDQLQFAEEALPDWAREGAITTPSMATENFSLSYQLQKQNFSSSPIPSATPATAAPVTGTPVAAPAQGFMEFNLAPAAETPVAPAEKKTTTAQTTSGKQVEIKPFEFPRITK